MQGCLPLDCHSSPVLGIQGVCSPGPLLGFHVHLTVSAQFPSPGYMCGERV